MPMIDSDTLKPALEDWVAAREAWAMAAYVSRRNSHRLKSSSLLSSEARLRLGFSIRGPVVKVGGMGHRRG
jgi:hypothetical protein